MQYNQTIQLRDGRACVLRHALAEDAAAVIDNFNLTHGETDYLLTYPDESRSDVAAETRFLQAKADSANEVEIIAQVGDVIAGTAGIDAVGGRYKLRHRAEFGVSVAREYWGLGIGRALLNACIDCARQAGGLYPAGAGCGGRQRPCHGSVHPGRLYRVWPQSQRLQIPHGGVSGAGVYAAGDVNAVKDRNIS